MIKSQEPTIAFIEEPQKDGRVISIISCEGMIVAKLTERDDLLGKAITSLMAAYYVYHVSYPREHTSKHTSILQFFQDVLMKKTEDNAKRHEITYLHG